jgi:hypothetical protein
LLVTDPSGLFSSPQVEHDNEQLAGQIRPDAQVDTLQTILDHVHAWS